VYFVPSAVKVAIKFDFKFFHSLVYLFSFALILFIGYLVKDLDGWLPSFFYIPFSQQSKAIEPLAAVA
jgi:hypothetical protein